MAFKIDYLKSSTEVILVIKNSLQNTLMKLVLNLEFLIGKTDYEGDGQHFHFEGNICNNEVNERHF